MRNLNLHQLTLASGGFLLSAAAMLVAQAEDKPDAKPAAAPVVQPPKNPNGNGANPNQPTEQMLKISELLKQGDTAGREQALPQIQDLIQSDPRKIGGMLRGIWLKSLEDAKLYDNVSELCLRYMLAAPDDVVAVEDVLNTRARVLLLSGKKAEALVVAKQCFNYSSMKNTGNAILLVSQCLNAAYPEDRDILKKFRLEQVEGAKSTATVPPDKVAAAVLGKIAIDAHVIDVALRRWTLENYKNLAMRGNLLLLADRNQDAFDTFERAYTVADIKDLNAASENIARAMKARDGSIGPANAWIASIRPKLQGASLQDLKIDATPTAQNPVRKQP
jgi:hypothetical protein